MNWWTGYTGVRQPTGTTNWPGDEASATEQWLAVLASLGHGQAQATRVPTDRHGILIAGLGDVAQSHLKALEQTPGADVVAGVDIAAKPGIFFRKHPVPVYQTPREAKAHHHPDIVVVATPTPVHRIVCDQVADCFPTARILVEKPAANDLPGARHVLEDIGSFQPVDVAYHMAFSPEVFWGMQIAQAAPAELGVLVAMEASFADPYTDQFDAARSRLGNSWIDSGINALSVLSRFASPIQCTSLRRVGKESHSMFEAHVAIHAVDKALEARILTNWHVTAPAKTTRLRYGSGAELVLDHTAVAGHLIQGGQITARYSHDCITPRRERRYLALYRWWLTEGNAPLPGETSIRLHELLFQQYQSE